MSAAIVKIDILPDGTKANHVCLDGAGEIPPNIARAMNELLVIIDANGDLDWLMDIVHDQYNGKRG